LIGELDRPGRAAIEGLIDAEIRGVVTNGHQVRDFVAHAVHIAELQILGSRHNGRFPGLSAVRRDYIRAASPGCPNDAGVYGTNTNQQLIGAALLWSELGLLNFPNSLSKGASSEDCGCGKQKNAQRRSQHWIHPDRSSDSRAEMAGWAYSFRPLYGES